MSDELSVSRENMGFRSRNVDITIARVMAMLMIILCHLCSWLGQNALAMIFNVGVYVFLLISGMLYSQKIIDHAGTFLLKRWTKLCIPLYFLIIPLWIVSMAAGRQAKIAALLVYIFDLQGLNFIFSKLTVPQINGLEHTWFITVIMMCYLIMIPVKRVDKDCMWTNKMWILWEVVLFITIDICCLYTLAIRLDYFLTFFLGYALGKRNGQISKKTYVAICICMLAAMATRLGGRVLLDGSILYGSVIAPFTHIVLAIWIFASIKMIDSTLPKLVKTIADSRVVRYLERYSMYLYLTHYMFLVGPFPVKMIPMPRAMQILVFLIAAMLSAMLLEFLSGLVIKKVAKGKQ